MKVWNSETRQSDEIAIPEMDDDMLIGEYSAECESESRRISSDPPSHENELREEIDKRLATAARLTALLEDRQGLAKLLANVITGEAFTYSMGREIRDGQTEFDTGEMTHFGIDGEIDLFVVADRLIAYLKPLG